MNNNNNSIEVRVTRLEYRTDNHETALLKITKESEKMGESLKTIKDTLNQIKWLAMGAVFAFAVQILGIKDFIKLVF